MNVDTKAIETGKNAPKAKKDSNQTLYDLVVAQGYNFKKIIPYLAESFGVCTKDEYNQALASSDKTKNIEYNLKIRKMLLSGKTIEPPNIKVDQFDKSKQDIIKKQFGLYTKYQGFSSYINGLDTNQIKELNKMSDADFQSFLSQQASESRDVSVNSQKNINKGSIEQIKNIALLTAFERKLNDFKEKNPSLKSILLSKDEDVDAHYNKLRPEQQMKLLNAYGNEAEAKRSLKQSIDYTLINSSNQFKQLSPERQQEFNQMMVEYCAYHESIGLGDELKEIWGEDLYVSTQNTSINQTKEGNSSSIDTIKNEIVDDKNVNEYFKENQIKDIVHEENKDALYYVNLRKLYPEVDKLIDKDQEIQKLMKIKKPTEKEKEALEKKIQEKTRSSEESLHSDTNAVIQKQAVTGCLDVLQSYMDINLTQQENVLEQFARVDNKELIGRDSTDIILTIDGKINNNNIKIYYNLTDGTLQQEEFLSRGGVNTPFYINDPVGGTKDVVGIQLPKFQDFVTGAKGLKYGKLMNDAKDLATYEKDVAYELRDTVKKQGVRNIDTEKSIFQKNIVQNVVAQELFGFMGKSNDMSPEICATNQNAEVYTMYNLVYNTLHYYTIDELKVLRTSIAKLIIQKDKYVQNSKEKDNNNEKYLLGLLGNQATLSNQKVTKTPYAGLPIYASFFSIFQTTEANISMIDLTVWEKFVSNSENEVSTDQEYLDGQDMQLNFKKTISGMENNLDMADLEKDIENLPDTKKSV